MGRVTVKVIMRVVIIIIIIIIIIMIKVIMITIHSILEKPILIMIRGEMRG